MQSRFATFTPATTSPPPRDWRSASPPTVSLNSSTKPPPHNITMHNDHSQPIIYAYTRSQAIADGFQVEVSKVAREAGITHPVFLTRAVYDSFVLVPPGVTAQDEAGRLWDIVWMLRFAIRKAKRSQTR